MDVRTFAPLDTWMQDICHALRTLRKNPGVSFVIVTTLVLGIGANTAIFSVVDTVLLKPLPYPRDEQLVVLRETVRRPGYEREQDTVTMADFVDWRSRSTSFDELAAIRFRSFDLSDPHEGGRPARVEGDRVSASLFSVLRVTPAVGRTFTQEDDRPGSPPVVILGYSLWMSRFGGDPRAVGQAIRLDGLNYTIVGVMPEWFRFWSLDDQLWVPLDLTPEDMTNRVDHPLIVLGRLKPAVSLPLAQAEMQDVTRQLADEFPNTNTGVGVRVQSFREHSVGDVQSAILVLWGCSGLVLLIVCANVAGLLLTRASVRRREFAIRVALGASRARLLRQLLTEGILLSTLGGCLGLLAAVWGIQALRWMSPPPSFPYLPRLNDIAINGTVLGVTALVSCVSGLLFGVIPAVQVNTVTPNPSATDGGRGSMGGPRRWARTMLIGFEMALGTVVLVGTMLLLRSYLQLTQVSLGFQPQHVLSLRVIPRGPKYTTVAARIAFYDQVCQRIEELPGVQRAGAVTFMPLTWVKDLRRFVIEGQARPMPGDEPAADTRVVTASYFASLRIPLVEGRTFSQADRAGSLPVAIVSHQLARKFWPRGDAVGRRLILSRPGAPTITIIGIVGDVRNYDMIHEPEPTLYLPYDQSDDRQLFLLDLLVRSAVEPDAIAEPVRKAIWSVDPSLSVARVQSMEDVRAVAVAPQWFNLRLLGLMALLSVVLAAEGLYGMTAYAVAQRTREIGLRVALGANSKEVLGLVLAEGGKVTLIGVLSGGVGALLATRVMNSLLFHVAPADPITYGGAIALLSLVALTACYVPARRAMRIDPVEALRCE